MGTNSSEYMREYYRRRMEDPEYRARKNAKALARLARKKAEDPAAWNAKQNDYHRATKERRRETDPDGYAAAMAKKAEQIREWHERKKAEDPEAYRAYMSRYRKPKAERTNP